MSMLLVVALLAQAPERVLLPSQNKQVTQRDDDWAAEREQALAEAMEPAFVITPPTGWAEGATKRFVGAFVGGLVGMAIPALGVATTPSCTVFGCVLAAGLAPAVSVVGATLGFSLMGGRMSAGAAIGGMIGGLAAGLGLLLFQRIIVTDSNQSQWGAVIAAGAIAVAIEAIALESRHDALEEAPFIDVPTSRLAFTSLGLLGTLAGIGLLSTGIALLGFPTGTTVAPIFAVLGMAAAPLVPWAIHRSNGGEGTLGAAYGGWLASLAVAGAGILVAVLSSFGSITMGNDPRTAAMLGGGISLAVIAGVFGTPLMLEWSHGNARRERAKVPPRVKAQLTMSPLAGPQGLNGGAVGISGTF
jgi:MFS family permease